MGDVASNHFSHFIVHHMFSVEKYSQNDVKMQSTFYGCSYYLLLSELHNEVGEWGTREKYL